MFAIISHKGNQYKFEPDKSYKIDLIKQEKAPTISLRADVEVPTESVGKEKITFSEVLVISDEKKNIIGSPLIPNASVEAEIVGNAVDKKIGVFKFHSKKRYQRNHGHREDYTLVKILKINQKNENN